MLTAAVRDLHRGYPGRFVTDVRTSCGALWENNPYLTELCGCEAGVEMIECEYPLIHESNQRPVHFLHGFIDFLNRRLRLDIQLTEMRADIHLSGEERQAASAVAQWCGGEVPYWIIAAGGKYDYTIKWWDIARWQAVVDHFQGRLCFAQVGERGHHHPKLRGALDLRGRTSMRALIRLMHHAQGVACPVTCLMHLAAAVPGANPHVPDRPCVVVAGGREPVAWEAYPAHRYLHTIGALPCCAQGGCWRARTEPLGDGDGKDQPQALCQRPVPLPEAGEPDGKVVPHFLPECMDRITAADVIAAIESYLAEGQARQLTKAEARRSDAGIARMEAKCARERAVWEQRQVAEKDCDFRIDSGPRSEVLSRPV